MRTRVDLLFVAIPLFSQLVVCINIDIHGFTLDADIHGELALQFFLDPPKS